MYAYCFDKTPHSQDWTKRKLIVINWENINLNSQVLRSSFVTFSHKLEGNNGGVLNTVKIFSKFWKITKEKLSNTAIL